MKPALLLLTLLLAACATKSAHIPVRIATARAAGLLAKMGLLTLADPPSDSG